MFIKTPIINMSIKTNSENAENGFFLDKTRHNFGDMTEDEEAKLYASITQKLKSGKRLSPKEIDFIRQTDPQLYMQYVRIRANAEAMEAQLKNAKTKQQVNNIVIMSTNSVSEKDPCREYVLAALQRVAEEFRASPEYARLPATEDKDEKKNGDKYKVDKDGKDDEDEEEDIFSWSPLYEEVKNMPKFNVRS